MSWTSDHHDPIEELTENLWRIEGPLPNVQLRRVMTAAKRNDGDVVVHSAICLQEQAQQRLEAWGRVGYIVVPNRFHRMAAPAYRERYPDAKVVCPAGARKHVEKVVAVDMTYEEFPPDDAVRFETLDGLGGGEGAMVVTSEDGTTLVFTDAIFDTPHGTGVFGFVFRHITASTGGPRVSRLFKLAALKDKAAFRASLLHLAETPELRRLIVAHHRMTTDDPAGTLRSVAAAL